MFTSWIKRIGYARLVALATMGIMTGGVLLEAAEARVGRSRGGFSRSFGSRGSRTFDNGAPGNRMQPMDSTRTPRNQMNNPNNSLNNNRGSWLQRNPLLGGLLGGIAGTVIGSMIMNAFGGMNGGGGIVMLLLLAGIAFMLVMAAMKLFKGRSGPALAGNNSFGGNNFGGSGFGSNGFGNNGLNNSGFGGNGNGNSYGDSYGQNNPGAGVNTQTREQGLAAIALEDPTMSNEKLQDTLSSLFFQIQEAYSAGDRSTLMNAATPEMYNEMVNDLMDMERRQERNVIKNIVMRSFDISEAWQEGNVEYATANINARLIDYTERNGQVIEGDPSNPTQFSEYWTFVRPRGRGDWQLSAINQPA